MKYIQEHNIHILLIFSHFHYSIIIIFVFLFCSTHCYAGSLPGTLAMHSKEDIVIVQINGPTQPPGFSPALLTVHVNDKVVFINHTLPARSYTLSADDGSFSSPPIPAGGQWAITFHALGSHTYRDTSATSTMIGELMIVAKNIHLLATPDPLIEATAITFIKNGQNPPDTIIIPTHKHAATSPSGPFIPMLILIVGITISAIVLSFLGIIFYRRWRQRALSIDEDLDDELTIPDDDDTSSEHMQQIRIIIDNAKKKLQAYPPFKAGKSDDDDDYDDF